MAQELSDAVWEVFTPTGGPITYANFQRMLVEMEVADICLRRLWQGLTESMWCV